MSSRILTYYVASIDALIRDPYSIFSNAKEEIVAIFINNTPVFYVISAQRLSQLLELEIHMNRKTITKDRRLQNLCINKDLSNSLITTVPVGKFVMYPGWQPDSDFQRIAALWGITLTQPVTSEELAAFTAYWQAEGKLFHHIQWQQKLARSIQISRTNNKRQSNSNINVISEQENQIPPGFRK